MLTLTHCVCTVLGCPGETQWDLCWLQEASNSQWVGSPIRAVQYSGSDVGWNPGKSVGGVCSTAFHCCGSTCTASFKFCAAHVVGIDQPVTLLLDDRLLECI